MDKDLSQRNHLQDFLQNQIPSVRDLRFQLVEVTPERVLAKAPLIENSNHIGTAFGGSLYSLLVLTCYSWLYSAVTSDGASCRIVIQTGSIEYNSPVDNTIECQCNAPEAKSWNQFQKILKKKSKSRIELSAEVINDQKVAAIFRGVFVVSSKS